MPSRDSDTAASPLRVFGSMLRFYRVKAGMSQDQLGGRVYLTGDMIGKVETGQRTPSEQLVDAIEALPELGTDGALTELRDVLRDYLKRRPYPAGSRTGPVRRPRRRPCAASSRC
jgi:transcriptional regulator with XRE-family HTH domain